MYIRKANSSEDWGKEVAYWRKSNQIHRWFVDNVQDGIDDCEVHRPLTENDLKVLKGLCALALNTHNDKLLPPMAGFFFGDISTDSYYWRDIENTINQLDSVLSDWDNTFQYYYQSSW